MSQGALAADGHSGREVTFLLGVSTPDGLPHPTPPTHIQAALIALSGLAKVKGGQQAGGRCATDVHRYLEEGGVYFHLAHIGSLLGIQIFKLIKVKKIRFFEKLKKKEEDEEDNNRKEK